MASASASFWRPLASLRARGCCARFRQLRAAGFQILLASVSLFSQQVPWILAGHEYKEQSGQKAVRFRRPTRPPRGTLDNPSLTICAPCCFSKQRVEKREYLRGLQMAMCVIPFRLRGSDRTTIPTSYQPVAWRYIFAPASRADSMPALPSWIAAFPRFSNSPASSCRCEVCV